MPRVYWVNSTPNPLVLLVIIINCLLEQSQIQHRVVMHSKHDMVKVNHGDLRLAQRRRRWHNCKAALGHRVLFAAVLSSAH